MIHTSESVEIQMDADTRQLAERAAAVLGGISLAEFITNLIRENAPEILRHETAIRLSNTQFDNFIAICNDTERQPDARTLEAAKRLDTEGF